jgi:23S rRNA (adenine-N6)-dimethyltransferase
MQREAAARFLGEPRETLAALLLKPWFEPALVHHFRRTDFDPTPQVEVVMLRLRKRGPPLIDSDHAQLFRDFVVFAFTAWQPTVRDALVPVYGAAQARRIGHRSSVDLGRPPTAVRFEDWLKLFAAFVIEVSEPKQRAILGAEGRLRDQQAMLRKEHRTRVAGRTW